MNQAKFHDNTHVARNRFGHEYFSLTLQEQQDAYSPYTVALYRYCVPGRIDSYCFTHTISKIGGMPSTTNFSSEGGLSLPAAIKMLHRDLEKPQVVELIKEACRKERLWCETKVLLEFLLVAIAPRSKALRAGRKTFAAMMALRKLRKQSLRDQSGIPQ